MKKLLIILSVCFLSSSVFVQSPAASSKEFIENNPDIRKYEFVRDYLIALSYLQASSKKFANRQNELATIFLNNETIRQQVQFLIQDSINWRIAKKLIEKYRTPQNGLMLKTADLFVRLSDEQIEYNSQERAIWNRYLRQGNSPEVPKLNDENFAAPLKALEVQRRVAWQKLLEASFLASKVLISNQSDYSGELTYLGVTKKERTSLLERLDDFTGEGFKGTARDGQTFLEASVSAIREVLESPDYKSVNP